MKGKKITKQQKDIFMKAKKKGFTQQAAAAQAGMSERAARNLEKRNPTGTNAKRSYRTRKDPFEDVWETEVIPLLEKSPNLQAQTILEELQRNYPDAFPDGVLRTLYRRVQNWKALYGPEKSLIFRQRHPIGWQGMSDFTSGDNLGVTIREESLKHLLYHYWLPYSSWEHVEVVLGGESFTSLSSGVQNALWACGGAPKTHRTDSLSAAYKNLPNKKKEEFTENYTALCDQYGMEPTRNNKGVSNENGSVEASHGGLKNRIKQALLIRGSNDFNSIAEYREFIYEIARRHNRRIHKAYTEELSHLNDLPEHRAMDFQEKRVMVTSGGTINICDRIYSVPSRLIGITLKVHLYDDRLECFVGGTHVKMMLRIRGDKKHSINYRDVAESLLRKPQAFRNYIYQGDMFPTLAFSQAWTMLDKELSERESCKEYVKILKYAAQAPQNEIIVHEYLEAQLLAKKLPRSEDVIKLFRKEIDEFPKNISKEPDLKIFDALMGGSK